MACATATDRLLRKRGASVVLWQPVPYTQILEVLGENTPTTLISIFFPPPPPSPPHILPDPEGVPKIPPKPTPNMVPRPRNQREPRSLPLHLRPGSLARA